MTEPSTRRLVMTPATDIGDDVPTWAWSYGGRGRIAVGTVALFAGRPGAGKSTSARWLTAQATTGTLPGEWNGKPVSVAYLAREESVNYIVKPSLRAHGADLRRVYFPSVEVPDGEGIRETPVAVADMEALTEACIELGIRVVVVDPLMAMLGAKTDAHRNNEVRAQLDPWRRMAEDIDGVVIGVAHLNKSGNGDVVAGINGSSAFGEIARAVFGFAKDPESEDDHRVMSQEKNSLGDESLALSYRIDSQQVTTDSGRTSEVGKFVLLGDSDRSVGDVLRDAGRGSGGMDETERDNAAEWLKQYIGDRIVDSAEAKQDGKAAGFSERTLQRARQELSVLILPDGRKSTWSLPTHARAPQGETGGTGGTGGTGREVAVQGGVGEPMPPVPPMPRVSASEDGGTRPMDEHGLWIEPDVGAVA